MAHSKQTRAKALRMLTRGVSKAETARILGISQVTVRAWSKQQTTTPTPRTVKRPAVATTTSALDVQGLVHGFLEKLIKARLNRMINEL